MKKADVLVTGATRMTKDENGRRFPWPLFVSELVGTALLVLVGLSLVIVMFGAGSPIERDCCPMRGCDG